MLFRVPHYYDDFKCTADKCSDNCCVGWEIDIDEQTDAFYKTVGGSLGERLRQDIIRDGVPHFRLMGNRCAFLNERNLCDIIATLGDEKLCHICREHPRYYNRYENLIEGGVGLSCEAAARLILTDPSPLYVTEKHIEDEYTATDKELFSLLYTAREEILKTAAEEKPFGKKAAVLLDFAERLQENIDNNILALPVLQNTEPATVGDIKGITEFLLTLDFLEEENRELLLSSEQNKIKRQEKFLTNIFIYFIRRYFLNGVFSGEILSYVKFAVSAAAVIARIAENDSLPAFIYAAKKFSKEFEYSDINLEKILDATYDCPSFSTENLKALF